METGTFTTFIGKDSSIGYPFGMRNLIITLNSMGIIPSVEQSYQTNAYGILTKVTYTITYKKA